MRKTYIDNIRWATVLLVLIYHVCYVFNGVGVPGGIPNAENIPAFDALAYVVYPWFMVLLFVIAGMSARYSLMKRTVKQFLKERVVKLLVPSTLGLFVIHWITGYLNIKMGGGLEYIPSVLIYPISAVSGTGPLWFIQMLFVFSCILALLKKIDKNDRVWKACKDANLPIILSLFVVIFGAAQILNMPVLTTYRFGIYFASFLIGYYVFSHDEVQKKIESICIPMLCLAVIGAVCYTFYYFGSNYTSPECLQSIITNLYLWIVVLAVIGGAKKYCSRETAFTRYMAKSSFGFYILHYPVLTVVCYLLHYRFELPAIYNYAIALAAELLITFVLYEVIKRAPVLRCLILGISCRTRQNVSCHPTFSAK
jgi:glucan biosynthesis protein C